MGASRNENQGLQLDAVAHGNHDFALHVVEGVDPRSKSCRYFTWQGVGRGRRRGSHRHESRAQQRNCRTAACGACTRKNGRHQRAPDWGIYARRKFSPQCQAGRNDAQETCGHECGQVGCEFGARQSGAERRRRRTQLVAGKYPAEYEIGLLAAESLDGDAHRRRHGGDPVQAVEQREQGLAPGQVKSANGR